MKIEAARVDADQHTRVQFFRGAVLAYDAVMVPMDEAMVVSVTLERFTNPYLVAVDLLLAASETPGLPPTERVHLLAEAMRLAEAGHIAKANKTKGEDTNHGVFTFGQDGDEVEF